MEKHTYVILNMLVWSTPTIKLSKRFKYLGKTFSYKCFINGIRRNCNKKLRYILQRGLCTSVCNIKLCAVSQQYTEWKIDTSRLYTENFSLTSYSNNFYSPTCFFQSVINVSCFTIRWEIPIVYNCMKKFAFLNHVLTKM